MSTTKLNAYSIARCAFVVAGVALLGGCQSSAPEPVDMARTNLQTAPADLQLICANAVVAQAGGARVLPTSSRQLDATSYSVDVDAGGRKFNCVVDSSGSIRSVQPV